MIEEPTPWTIAGSSLVSVAAAIGAVIALAPIIDPSPAKQAVVPLVVTPPPTPDAPPSPPPVTLAVPAVHEPAPIVRPPCSLVATVHFAYGQATLPREVDEQLAPLIEFATMHPASTIVVDGHADPTGDDLGNLQLSKRRAGGIARELARRGVNNPIATRAFGAFVPAGTTDVKAAQRRAVIEIREPDCEGDKP